MKIQKILLTASAAVLFATTANAAATLVTYASKLDYHTAGTKAITGGNLGADNTLPENMSDSGLTMTFRNALGNRPHLGQGNSVLEADGTVTTDGWLMAQQYAGDVRDGTSSENNYFEFTLAADEGYALSLGNISYTWNAGVNNTDAMSWYSNIYYTLDGGATYLKLLADDKTLSAQGVSATGTVWAGSAQIVTSGLNLSDAMAALQLDYIEEITFRIAFGASSGGGSGSGVLFKDISVTGSVVPIPEPSTYALGAAGLLAGLALIRRRRK